MAETVVADPGVGVGGPVPEPASGLGGPPVTPAGSDPKPAAPATPEPKTIAPVPPIPTEPAGGKVAAPATKTLADGAKTPTEADTKPVAAPADWPEDWRQKMAGDNKQFLKALERFGSPADVYKSYRALEQRMSSGELKKALPTNATAEELAAWRKDNGVPDDPTGYDLNIGGGIVWGEADKPLLDDYTKWAHDRNMTPSQVKDNLAWYASMQERQRAELDERDDRAKSTGEDALRAEWGTEFKRNLNAVGNLFVGAPDGMFDKMMVARAPDGNLIGNSPEAMKWFAQLSRELNPVASLVPAGSDQAVSARQRFDELTKMQRNFNQGDYYKGPHAMALQAEWRDLYSALEKIGDKNLPK